ncbi:MAG: hypothetical protein V4463_04905 [Pseudomonadota bacterium]
MMIEALRHLPRRRRFLLALLAMPAAWAGRLPTITLVGSTTTWVSPQGPWLDLIYREAFRRLGYDFRFMNVPGKRASALSDAGEVDGEIHRVPGYGAAHPNLLLVDEPHFMGKFVAYAKRPIVLAPGWDSLKGTTYLIEYRLGSQRIEDMLRTRVDPARISTVGVPDQGLQKLAFGRSDLFIDVNYNVDLLLEDARYREAGIHPVAVMEETGGYAFLHKKHAALVPRLVEVLQQMKREGLVDAYQKQAMQVWRARQTP